MIVAEALRAWVAAARGALEWHLETGDLELPVPDGFRPPPLGQIAAGWTPDPAALSSAAPGPAAPSPTAPSPELTTTRGAIAGRGFARLGDVAAALAPASGSPPMSPAPVSPAPVSPAPVSPAPAAAPRSAGGPPSPIGAAQTAATAPGPAPAGPLETPAGAPVAPSAEPPIALPTEGPVAAAAGLAQLRAEIGDCRRCPLSQGRTELVFGVGDPQARLMCVADRPGAHDDLVGLPFADEAGALLGKMVRAMRLDRGRVYLTHLVKCRDQRGAEPGLDACQGFLNRQIALVQPTVILALGDLAAQRLTGEQATLPHLRGKWFEYQGVPVRATFHPNALNHPRIKREAWNDLKKVMRKLGIPLTQR